MPGRWGLPGGKYYLHESISEGTQRKIREEAGVACEIKGLFKIVQILMPEKTVYHFVFIADYVSGDPEAVDVALHFLLDGIAHIILDEAFQHRDGGGDGLDQDLGGPDERERPGGP